MRFHFSKRILSIAFVGGLLVSPMAWATLPTTIDVLTSEYPPFNFTKDGKTTGFATEVVEATLKEAGIKGNIMVQPWARALDTAQNSENVMIYSTAHTEKREKLFKWAGQIFPAQSVLYALKGSTIKIDKLDDAKKYRLGTVNGDSREQYLEKKGFVVGQSLDRTNHHDANYLKLKAGRIDLWPANKVLAAYTARQAGDDPKAVLVPVYEIVDSPATGGYMAFGLKTSDELVEKIRQALERIHKNGVYDAIAKKWL